MNSHTPHSAYNSAVQYGNTEKKIKSNSKKKPVQPPIPPATPTDPALLVRHTPEHGGHIIGPCRAIKQTAKCHSKTNTLRASPKQDRANAN